MIYNVGLLSFILCKSTQRKVSSFLLKISTHFIFNLYNYLKQFFFCVETPTGCFQIQLCFLSERVRWAVPRGISVSLSAISGLTKRFSVS